MMHDVPRIEDTIPHNLTRANEIIPYVLHHHTYGYPNNWDAYTSLDITQHYDKVLSAYIYQDNIWYHPSLRDNAAPAIDIEFSSYSLHQLLYTQVRTRKDAVSNILLEMTIVEKVNDTWELQDNVHIHISTDRYYNYYSEKYNIVIFDRYLYDTEPDTITDFINLIYKPTRPKIGLTIAVLPKIITIDVSMLDISTYVDRNSIFLWALRNAQSKNIKIKSVKLVWSKTPILHIRDLLADIHFNNYNNFAPSTIRIYAHKQRGISTESYTDISRALMGAVWKTPKPFEFTLSFVNVPQYISKVFLTNYNMIY